MRIRIGLTLTVSWALGPACAEPPMEVISGTAIENVSVIDVTDGTVSAGMTVVIDGSRISAVEPSDRVDLAESVREIDGTGRFLIPGLWDMHVHAVFPGAESTLTLFVANGVTGVRDMWGMLQLAEPYREAIANGDHPGPRFVLSGNLVDGANPWWPGSTVVETAEAAAGIVDSLHAAGAGFIKVYSVLERDAFDAIVARATEVGLDVAGHVPFSVPALAASEAGMRSMTHLFGVTEGCSTADEMVRAERSAWLAQRAAGEAARNPFFDPGLYRQLLDGADEQVCGALMDRLAADETWQSPTLTVLRSFSRLDDSAFKADPRREYLPAAMTEGWDGMAGAFASAPGADWATSREFFEMQKRVTGTAYHHGVPLLAGTDTPNPYVFPGFSLHDELELLVEAGLPPLAALQAATIAPARFLSATDSLGTVEPGKLADLLLLDANPLEDITATTRIAAVIANGRFYDRAALDELLEGVRAAANPD